MSDRNIIHGDELIREKLAAAAQAIREDQAVLAQRDATIAELRATISQLECLAEPDDTDKIISDQQATIAELRQQLTEETNASN